VNVACLQFDPVLMRVADNQRRADSLISRQLRPGSVNLLLLPEMAFTGYVFRSREEVFPYCESPLSGPTSAWCSATARRLGCVVAAGFPERSTDNVLYNSLLAVDRNGTLVHVYRKHFLYTTDESWATEGPGFSVVELPGLGTCAPGICMDLNPKQFKAPFDRYEFASSLFEPPLEHLETPSHHRLKAGMILLANNWLRPPADAELGDHEFSWHLVNYWATRLSPVLGQSAVAVIANRVGIEREVRFAGSSCVIDLKNRRLLGQLDGNEEDVLIVDIET
jgi:protein N-terminal amidase